MDSQIKYENRKLRKSELGFEYHMSRPTSESQMIEGRKYDENVVLSYFEIHVIVIAYTPVQLSSQTS